jgi:hypothetical protein
MVKDTTNGYGQGSVGVSEQAALEDQQQDKNGGSGLDATNGINASQPVWSNENSFNNPMMQTMHTGMPNGGWPEYSTMMGEVSYQDYQDQKLIM